MLLSSMSFVKNVGTQQKAAQMKLKKGKALRRGTTRLFRQFAHISVTFKVLRGRQKTRNNSKKIQTNLRTQ